MNNRKFQPIRTVIKLFHSSGRSHTIEQRLKDQYKAEAYYAAPMPRI